MHIALNDMYVQMARRFDFMIMTDTAANKPTADGTRRLFYASDEAYKAYFDDGAWSTSSAVPTAHKASHENGGSDEISVAGLSGELADAQPPKAHAASHQSGGSDSVKLDDLAAPDDNTDLNATTTKHGLLLKAVAPAASVLNVVGIANAETAYANKSIFDSTNPAALGTASPGTSLIAAHRDHVHTLPKLDDLATPDDNTDLNVSTSAHGLVPKAPNDVLKFLRGDATWDTPNRKFVAYGSVTLTVTSGSTSAIPIPTEVLDGDGWHSGTNTYITLPSAGVYLVGVYVLGTGTAGEAFFINTTSTAGYGGTWAKVTSTISSGAAVAGGSFVVYASASTNMYLNLNNDGANSISITDAFIYVVKLT
jgi:hypothetical protein